MQHHPPDPVRGPYGARAVSAGTVRRLATFGASVLVAVAVALGPGAAVTQALTAGMPAGAPTVQGRSVAGDVMTPGARAATPWTANLRSPATETADDAARRRPSATSWLLAGTLVLAAAVLTGLLLLRRSGAGR